MIGWLFAIEARAKEQKLQREQIQALRQKESQPILAVIEERLSLWGRRCCRRALSATLLVMPKDSSRR